MERGKEQPCVDYVCYGLVAKNKDISLLRGERYTKPLAELVRRLLPSNWHAEGEVDDAKEPNRN